MKRFLTALAVGAMMLPLAQPAFAQDRDHDNDQNWQGHHEDHNGPPGHDEHRTNGNGNRDEHRGNRDQGEHHDQATPNHGAAVIQARPNQVRVEERHDDRDRDHGRDRDWDHDGDRDHWRGWHTDRDIRYFHTRDLGAWRHGHWFHGHHGDRDGWWWIVGNLFYFYPQAIYPYPDPYVPEAVLEEGPPSDDGYWYYCANPPGYYPYVDECFVPWRAVPQY